MNFGSLDPFAKGKPPGKSSDEIFKKPTGGGVGGKPKAEAVAAAALEKESEADFLKQDVVKDPPPRP